MPGQMPFIDRENELAQIKKLIGEWGARQIVCIHALGGMGKTRLLEEVHVLFAGMSATPILMADIIDFDERTLQLPENVERRLAQRLDEIAFEPYLRRLLDWRKMEAVGLSLEALQEQRKRLRQTFVENFNQVSSSRRVILRFDTTEALEREVWNHLIDLILAVKNTLFILAGRNARNLGESLLPKLGQNIKLTELEPLNEKAGQEYLEQKQRLLHVILEPEFVQKLLFLAAGRPILLDLAIDWLSRNPPPPWMMQDGPEKFSLLSPEEINQRQKDFEIQLVRHIADIRKPMDRLTLVMSHVYPLNLEMIAKLLNVSETEADILFNEAKNYIFVKSLSNDRISLHDEMRRMVQEYVWPEWDQRDNPRLHVSKLAAEYLRHEIQILTNNSNRLAEEQEKAHQEANPQVELNAFVAREALERELWTIREQLVVHTLFIDIKEGIKTFAEIFDEAENERQFFILEKLLGIVQPYEDKFGEEDKPVLVLRMAKWLRIQGKENQVRLAVDLLRELAKYTKGNRELELDLSVELAECEFELGNIPTALEMARRNLELSIEIGDPKKIAELRNGVGYLCRRMGLLSEAETLYTQSLLESGSVGYKREYATTLGNLAFIYSRLGSHTRALKLAHESLTIREELQLKSDIGLSHSIIGHIHRYQGTYDDAIYHFEQALDKFSLPYDGRWIATVYWGIGHTLWFKARKQKKILWEARDNLEKSIHLYEEYYPTETFAPLHEIGHVYWDLGNQETAREYFEKSLVVANRVYDAYYIVNGLTGLAELDYEQGKYDQLKQYAERVKAEFEDKGCQFPLFFGRMHRILGELAFDHRDYATAFREFADALPLIASHGGYTPYSWQTEKARIQARLRRLPESEARNWIRFMVDKWQARGELRALQELMSIGL